MSIVEEKEDLKYVYIQLNEENEQEWIDYYKNNNSYVESYYNGAKTPEVVSQIKQSAQDTANGFLHLLDIIKYGNKESSYKGKLPDVISGVAFITLPGASSYNTSNIIMSVGVFTTAEAKFYVMVGISLGFGCVNCTSKKRLSEKLSGFVAKIMSENPLFGTPKRSFITRPLQKMSELFKGNNVERNELHIPYSTNLELPVPSDANYSKKKTEVVRVGEIRKSQAIKWLEQCDNNCNDNSEECVLKECLGDIGFFHFFVGDVFSPRWPYTGKRIEAIKSQFGGRTRRRLRIRASRRTRHKRRESMR